jgi:hypothetical protein
MNKMIKKILASVLVITALFACDETVRIPAFKNAPNLRIQIRASDSFFNLGLLSTTKLVYDIYSENYKEIEEVELSVRYQKSGNPACNLGGCLGPFVVKTYTAADLAEGKGIIEAEEITMTELLTLFSLDPADIGGGDQFLFVNKTTMTDGRVYPSTTALGQDNVPTIYDTPGASFTGSFAGSVGCPFISSEIVGTYDLVLDDFGAAVDGHGNVQVIAGPGANQFTVQNIMGHGFNYVATVNPASGATSATVQEAWDPDYFGLPASYARGFAAAPAANLSATYSCVGQINFKFTYSVNVGTFTGTWNYKLLKQ